MPADQFAQNGFAIIPQVLNVEECESVAASFSRGEATSVGTRCLLSQDWSRELAAKLRQHSALASLIPRDYVAAQCTYFEKSRSRNWLVAVHQDLSIPVLERVEDPRLKGWSEKEGALFVQVPAEFLGELIAVRLHLDSCGPDDGPLKVWPGTHLLGQISAAAASARREEWVFVCTAERGSVLIMRPLLLHASSKANGSSLRRVLHFLFGPPILPCGLKWRYAV